MKNWKNAKDEKPKGNVLVVYLSPFFGSLVSEMTVAYYDDPTDYEDGSGKGWIQDPSGRPLYHVTHWTELPEAPADLDLKKITQTGLVEDFQNTVDLRASEEKSRA